MKRKIYEIKQKKERISTKAQKRINKRTAEITKYLMDLIKNVNED